MSLPRVPTEPESHRRFRTTPRGKTLDVHRDLTYAGRMFRRTPGIVTLAVAGLGIAIGFSTSIFSIVNGIAFKPSGIDEPSSVVRIFRGSEGGHSSTWPYSEFESNKTDVERHFLEAIDLAPDFAHRLRTARRVERYAGMAVHGYFCTPFGPGWALVGDAGYNRDFITAQGIQDAFRDAELCVRALDETYSGRRPFAEAMADYQSARDAQAMPMYELTAEIASLEPPSPELQQILEAAHGNQDAMDDFARVNAGVTSPVEFFSEESVRRIVAAR